MAQKKPYDPVQQEAIRSLARLTPNRITNTQEWQQINRQMDSGFPDTEQNRENDTALNKRRSNQEVSLPGFIIQLILFVLFLTAAGYGMYGIVTAFLSA